MAHRFSLLLCVEFVHDLALEVRAETLPRDLVHKEGRVYDPLLEAFPDGFCQIRSEAVKLISKEISAMEYRL